MEATTRTMLQAILKHLPFELNPILDVSLFFFIIFIFVLFKLLKPTRNEPNLPPSPPQFPLICNLHQLGTLPHRSLTALSHKYGPLMLLRLGQTPTLVVSSAHFAREIVKSHDVVFSDRPQTTAAKILFYGCIDVGFLPYGEEWRANKKICVLELLRGLNRFSTSEKRKLQIWLIRSAKLVLISTMIGSPLICLR